MKLIAICMIIFSIIPLLYNLYNEGNLLFICELIIIGCNLININIYERKYQRILIITQRYCGLLAILLPIIIQHQIRYAYCLYFSILTILLFNIEIPEADDDYYDDNDYYFEWKKINKTAHVFLKILAIQFILIYPIIMLSDSTKFGWFNYTNDQLIYLRLILYLILGISAWFEPNDALVRLIFSLLLGDGLCCIMISKNNYSLWNQGPISLFAAICLFFASNWQTNRIVIE